MARQPASKGVCQFCAALVSQATALKHMEKCPVLSEVRLTPRKGQVKASSIFIRIQSMQDPTFWMDLEVRHGTKLDQVDNYLRAIWLECCGHMSEFTLSGWGSPTIGMAKKVEDVFKSTLSLEHLYDFGETSHTSIKVKAVDDIGSFFAARKPIRLLIRNEQPAYACRAKDCTAPAELLSPGWQCEGRGPGYLCATHAKTDKLAKEYGDMLYPIFNSPRLGMCGYEGPAEPPY